MQHLLPNLVEFFNFSTCQLGDVPFRTLLSWPPFSLPVSSFCLSPPPLTCVPELAQLVLPSPSLCPQHRDATLWTSPDPSPRPFLKFSKGVACLMSLRVTDETGHTCFPEGKGEGLEVGANMDILAFLQNQS